MQRSVQLRSDIVGDLNRKEEIVNNLQANAANNIVVLIRLLWEDIVWSFFEELIAFDVLTDLYCGGTTLATLGTAVKNPLWLEKHFSTVQK